MAAAAVLIAGAGSSLADIVYYDYASAPVAVSIIASSPQLESGYLHLSTSGADELGGELEISFSAFADKKNKSYLAEMEFGAGFAFVASNEVVDANTSFNTAPSLFASITGKNQTTLYDGYLALLFDAGDGAVYHGWAEVSINVYVTASGKEAGASVDVLRMAYNNVADEAILAGAIPEPAVATLLLAFGGTLLSGKRIFGK